MLTGVVCLVAILLPLMKSVVFLLLLDLGAGNILLIPVLVNLGVPDAGSSAHCDGLRIVARRIY
jgi:hypothetical protein